MCFFDGNIGLILHAVEANAHSGMDLNGLEGPIYLEHLSASIDRIGVTISKALSESGKPSWVQGVFAVFVTVIGASSAYLFNYFHWRMVTKREAISESHTALVNLICKLESTSMKYWLRDYDEKNRSIEQESEILIKTNIHLITEHAQGIIKKQGNILSTSTILKLKRFPVEIFDVATGDDFESREKKASKNKASKISRLCLDIRTSLLSVDY